MTADPVTLSVIVLLGAVTFGLKVSGALLFRAVPQTGPVRRFIDALPGAILIALVVPYGLALGVPGAIGIVVSFAAMRITGNMLLSSAIGFAVAFGLHAVL
ncbi:MAG: AzlD domain-containing protein [Pseudomonadota bacterium]